LSRQNYAEPLSEGRPLLQGKERSRDEARRIAANIAKAADAAEPLN